MLLSAERVVLEGRAVAGVGIDIDAGGRIVQVGPLTKLGRPDCMLAHKVVLPGRVDAHARSWTRLTRPVDADADAIVPQMAPPPAAAPLTPAQLHIVARQAFLERARGGTTCVGEFLRLCCEPGAPPDGGLDAVLRAAQDVGIRLSAVCALGTRPAGIAGGWGGALEDFCVAFDTAVDAIVQADDPTLSWALGADTPAQMPLDALMALKVRLGHMPMHLPLAVSPRQRGADALGCIAASSAGCDLQAAWAALGDACTTFILGSDLSAAEGVQMQRSGALVCLGPGSLQGLGADRIDPAALGGAGMQICLGSGLQRQPQRLQRAISQLDPTLAAKRFHPVALLKMATLHGATALGVDAGKLAAGRWADLSAYDLRDRALGGADEQTLLGMLLHSGICPADVVVGGRFIVQGGQAGVGARAEAQWAAQFAALQAGLCL